MFLPNLLIWSVFFTISLGEVSCLNQPIENIVTDPTAIHCTTNPCENNGTCFVVAVPGTSTNSEVECTGEICLKFVFELRTWYEAGKDCISKGGELASFDSSIKHKLLIDSAINGELFYNRVKSIENKTTSKGEEDAFWTNGIYIKTSNGTSVTWMSTNTNPGNTILNCVMTRSVPGFSNNLQWIRANCTQMAKYICEIHRDKILKERTYQCRCDGDHYGFHCESTYFKYDLKTIINCTNDDIELVCPLGMVVSIDDAMYRLSAGTPMADKCSNFSQNLKGQTCDGSKNASILVADLCHGQNKCMFTINEGNGRADVCSSYYVYISYFCKPKDSLEMQYGRIANCGFDNDPEYPVYISCQGRTIEIEYAYFGHMAKYERNGVCKQAESDSFQDDYKDGCTSSYFYEYLVTRCNGKSFCAFIKDHKLLRYRCHNPVNITEDDMRVFVDLRFICRGNISDVIATSMNDEFYSTEEITTLSVKKCQTTYKEGLHWTETDAGGTSEQSCPDNQSGLATWLCTTDGEWHEDGPNFDECVPEWISNVISKSTSAAKIATSLTESLDDNDDLDVQTVTQTVAFMDDLISIQQKQLSQSTNLTQEEITDVAVDFQKELLYMASDLLQESILVVFESDQQEHEAANTATSISDAIEESAFLLADTLTSDSKEIKSENIDMKVRAIDHEYEGTDDEDHYLLSIGDEADDECSYLKLPRLTDEQTTTLLSMTAGLDYAEFSTAVDAFPNTSDFSSNINTTSSTYPLKGKLKMIFVKYKTLGKFLGTNTDGDEDEIPDNVTSAGGCLSNVTSCGTNMTKMILNSNVIGASLQFANHDVTKFEDGQTVEFCLTDLNTSLLGKRKCAFWYYDEIENVGEWLTDGCNTTTEDTYTICTCDHMTNFAILMDVHGVKIEQEHEDALKYITIIGCSISIVALIACIVTFSILKRLKSLRTTIHRNLCISLAASQFIFIVGIERTTNKVVCSVIAAVLHYFFLVSFMWMCLEGIHLYITLVRVFKAEEHVALHYYLAAYVLPLLIVIALAGTIPQGYGTDKFCWLSTESNFIYAFVAPVAAIILLNFVILVVSLKKAYASSKAMKQDATRTQQLRTWIKGAITLLFLLGSTWVTGLLFINENAVVMAYIFTILNSLQGFFIFLFYCFNNDAIKKEIRSWLSRKSWVPKKLREHLRQKPKLVTAYTLTSNPNQVEAKIANASTILCRYSEDYTIASLLTPAFDTDMVNSWSTLPQTNITSPSA